MRFIRFASPTSMVGTLLLFFLPWIEVRCDNHSENRVQTREVSGFQLAFGGWTDKTDGKVVESTFGKNRSELERKEHLIARNLMIIYGCVVFTGIVVGFAMRPSVGRVAVVGTAGLLALVLLLWVTLSCFSNVGGPPERIKNGTLDVTRQSRFTVWYYLSYLTNAGCLLLCIFEWLRVPLVHEVAAETGTKKGDIVD